MSSVTNLIIFQTSLVYSGRAEVRQLNDIAAYRRTDHVGDSLKSNYSCIFGLQNTMQYEFRDTVVINYNRFITSINLSLHTSQIYVPGKD